jgi:hypothetical protein
MEEPPESHPPLRDAMKLIKNGWCQEGYILQGVLEDP